MSWAFLRPSAEDTYLQALRTEGLGGQFASDAVAVAKGQAFCRGLRDGAEPQGMRADHIAVRTLCAEFAPGFHVLQQAHVTGTFTLYDSSYYGSGIAAYGGTCTGDGGYSDIGPGTDVVVKDGSGAVIATTALGSGSGTSSRCEFSFSEELLEPGERAVAGLDLVGIHIDADHAVAQPEADVGRRPLVDPLLDLLRCRGSALPAGEALRRLLLAPRRQRQGASEAGELVEPGRAPVRPGRRRGLHVAAPVATCRGNTRQATQGGVQPLRQRGRDLI